MAASIAHPLKIFFCPSRRPPVANTTYANSNFPNTAVDVIQKQYTAGLTYTTGLCDYAACNGSNLPVSGKQNTGAILSQIGGRATISSTDIVDGVSYTLLLGEKGGNFRLGMITNEDDLGFASAFSLVNFNTVRFTNATLLPIRDVEMVSGGPTGGAFGSAHNGTWNALMADGSVQGIGYNITSTVFTALGTIRGLEIIDDTQLVD